VCASSCVCVCVCACVRARVRARILKTLVFNLRLPFRGMLKYLLHDELNEFFVHNCSCRWKFVCAVAGNKPCVLHPLEVKGLGIRGWEG
jgi:hypothetical protein